MNSSVTNESDAIIEWLGLKFKDQADLDRARADLNERLQRITDAERQAWDQFAEI